MIVRTRGELIRGDTADSARSSELKGSEDFETVVDGRENRRKFPLKWVRRHHAERLIERTIEYALFSIIIAYMSSVL